MKGIVFNLLEEAVTMEHGDAAWLHLVEQAAGRGTYSSLASYPDAELLGIVDQAAAALSLSVPEVLRWFGEAAMPLLAERFAGLFELHRSSRSFILSINDIIHPEVRKLYAGAACPHFHFAEAEDGRLILGYQSQRQLCNLAHGFILGAARHFGDAVEVEHLSCTHSADPFCRLALSWT
ncbi:heme NO-binding domain-containing protein [Novosphingobium huizhouense]|uniref:heme NO-binding domain-containing protein n=1 Tax=Novosphingobium huizhouense TaxID=2866625 RepID=UPI001CD8B6F5|nr:heme NO-binding domain-containing protein [Novosphingobium huizhouense]